MATNQWKIDSSHSEITFMLKHLMISAVTGYFRECMAKAIIQGNNFGTAETVFEAKTTSIDKSFFK